MKGVFSSGVSGRLKTCSVTNNAIVVGLCACLVCRRFWCVFFNVGSRLSRCTLMKFEVGFHVNALALFCSRCCGLLSRCFGNFDALFLCVVYDGG